MNIECLANPMKGKKLPPDEKMDAEIFLPRRPKHATIANGVCLVTDEEYLSEGRRGQKKVKNVRKGEKEGENLIRLEKLRSVPTALPAADEDVEERGIYNTEDKDTKIQRQRHHLPAADEDVEEISVAMLHPMPIDSGFLCKKHRTEGSFSRELIFLGRI